MKKRHFYTSSAFIDLSPILEQRVFEDAGQFENTSPKLHDIARKLRICNSPIFIQREDVLVLLVREEILDVVVVRHIPIVHIRSEAIVFTVWIIVSVDEKSGSLPLGTVLFHKFRRGSDSTMMRNSFQCSLNPRRILPG